MVPMKVLWTPQWWAKSSCEYPCFSRSSRIRWPNALRISALPKVWNRPCMGLQRLHRRGAGATPGTTDPSGHCWSHWANRRAVFSLLCDRTKCVAPLVSNVR
jgi:hypothetical protein